MARLRRASYASSSKIVCSLRLRWGGDRSNPRIGLPECLRGEDIILTLKLIRAIRFHFNIMAIIQRHPSAALFVVFQGLFLFVGKINVNRSLGTAIGGHCGLSHIIFCFFLPADHIYSKISDTFVDFVICLRADSIMLKIMLIKNCLKFLRWNKVTVCAMRVNSRIYSRA